MHGSHVIRSDGIIYIIAMCSGQGRTANEVTLLPPHSEVPHGQMQARQENNAHAPV